MRKIEYLAFHRAYIFIMGHLFDFSRRLIKPRIETDADWDELKVTYQKLSQIINFSIYRFKFTTFTPSPPSPLVRFTAPSRALKRHGEFGGWCSNFCASRHFLIIKGMSSPASYVESVTECLGLPAEDSDHIPLAEESVDMLPTEADARRGIWEVVEWDTDPIKRWNAAGQYRKEMGK